MVENPNEIENYLNYIKENKKENEICTLILFYSKLL